MTENQRSNSPWIQSAPVDLFFFSFGWIWKVRSPSVGKPLGIEYAKPPQLQPA
jgi:hypothetical protein